MKKLLFILFSIFLLFCFFVSVFYFSFPFSFILFLFFIFLFLSFFIFYLLFLFSPSFPLSSSLPLSFSSSSSSSSSFPPLPLRSSFSRSSRFFALLFVFVFLFFSVSLSYSSFLSPIVSRLVPASAVAGAAGSITVPALIKGVTSGGLNVNSWCSLLIPGSTVAKVAGAVLGVAGALAIDYVFDNAPDWFAAKNLARLGSSIIDKSPVTYPSGYSSSLFDYGDMSGVTTSAKMYAVVASASAACEAARRVAPTGTVQTSACQGNWIRAGNGGEPATIVNAVAFWRNITGQAGLTYYWFYYPLSGVAQSPAVPGDSVPGIPAIVQSLTNDLANGVATAIEVGKRSLEVAANALESPSHPINQQAAIKAVMAAALAEPITQVQKDALEAQGTEAGTVPVPETTDYSKLTPAQIAAAVQQALQGQGLSATQIAAAIAAAQGANLTSAQTQAAVAAALAAQGLTAAQIAAAIAAANPALSAAAVETAVKAALNDETGVTAPIDPTILLPTKLSLTTILQSFMTSINNLPFLDALRGITVNCSGSSILCVNLPAKYGGTVCYNAAGITDALNNIGSAMLSITTLLSFIYIFRSN